MAYERIEHCDHVEYRTDLDKYESGMDETCPCCGAHIDSMDAPEFMDGIIQVVAHCPTCGKVLTFNYFLDNVIAEDGLE